MDDAQVMDRFREWDAQLARHDRIEVGFRRRRAAVMTLLCLAFAVIGGLIAVSSSGSDRVMGSVCLILFAGGSIALARIAFWRGPAAVITSRDIGSPPHKWSVPWPAVRGAFVFSTRGTHLVTVVVDPAWHAAWVSEHGVVKGLLARVNRAFLRVETMSLPAPLDVDHDLLAAWIDARGTESQAEGIGDVSPG
jgi:hypothetical protein